MADCLFLTISKTAARRRHPRMPTKIIVNPALFTNFQPMQTPAVPGPLTQKLKYLVSEAI